MGDSDRGGSGLASSRDEPPPRDRPRGPVRPVRLRPHPRALDRGPLGPRARRRRSTTSAEGGPRSSTSTWRRSRPSSPRSSRPGAGRRSSRSGSTPTTRTRSARRRRVPDRELEGRREGRRPAFWDQEFVPLGKLFPEAGDRKLSLNDVENRILRPKFKDARVHAALCCGARGSPPLPRGLRRREARAAARRRVASWLARSGRNRYDAKTETPAPLPDLRVVPRRLRPRRR
jgi:hypothetical protein